MHSLEIFKLFMEKLSVVFEMGGVRYIRILYFALRDVFKELL